MASTVEPDLRGVCAAFNRADALYVLEGVAPLDFAEVRATALEVDLDGETVVMCDLAHLDP